MKQFLLLLLLTVSGAFAQETYPATEKALTEKITALDKEAFDCFNTCNLDKFSTYFTSNLEFYHDKGGFTSGIEKFLDNTDKNICHNPDGKIIRKAIKESFKVYPLDGYGAILFGDHDFYVVKDGKEKRTGTAKFTHVWLLKDGQWKMARILSYAHRGVE